MMPPVDIQRHPSRVTNVALKKRDLTAPNFTVRGQTADGNVSANAMMETDCVPM